MEGRTIKRLLTTALILAAGLALPVNAAPKSVGYPAQAYYIQACTNEDKGDIKGAIEKMQRAIELKNDNALYYTKLAGLYQNLGEWDNALAAYKKAAQLRPDDSFLYLAIGQILQQKKDYANAPEAYKYVLQLTPSYKYNYLNLANIQYILKDFKGAVENYNVFLVNYPNHVDARKNLASAYIELGDYKNANEQFKISMEKHPENFNEYAQYGLSLGKNSEWNDARTILEKAIDVNKDDAASIANLGIVMERTGDEQMHLLCSKKH